jgi:programmed cell death 6-interacting protein
MQPVAASQFENLFDERLKRYDSDRDDLKREESEQDRLLARVSDANTSFQMAKKGDTSSKEREQALQNLENAFTSYREIMRNLETGRKFYNDLSAITTRFRDECRNFVYARRTEAQNMEADLSTSMAGLQLQHNTQQHLLQQRQQQQQYAAPQARMVEEPMPAPMPQRPNVPSNAPPVVNAVQSPQPAGQAQGTWSEGMPIMFGGGGGQGRTNGSGPATTGGGAWEPGQGIKFGSR